MQQKPDVFYGFTTFEDLFQVKEFKFKIVIIQEILGLPVFGFALFAARTFFFLFLVLILVILVFIFVDSGATDRLLYRSLLCRTAARTLFFLFLVIVFVLVVIVILFYITGRLFAAEAARTFFFLFLVLILIVVFVLFVVLFVIIIIVIVFIRASDFDDQVTTIIRTTITNAIRITTKRMLFAVWSMVAWLFLLVSSAFSRSLT